jgi:peroxiredoxin
LSDGRESAARHPDVQECIVRLWSIAVVLFAAALSLESVAAGPRPAQAPSRTTPLAVGATAPDFTLESHLGGTVSLSKALERGPVVLVFYRGSWCPFCARHLAQLRSLVAAGERVTLAAVSVDDVATSRSFAEKIAKDGHGAVSFPLLSDPGHKTIDAFGLHDSAYDGGEFDGVPHAAVYVIGTDGKVTWSHVSDDYKLRPSNDAIRAALAPK